MLTVPQTHSAAMPRQSGTLAAGRAWWLAAWVGGVFAFLIGVTLLAGHVRAKAEDPLKSPQLREYRETLRVNPTDEQTKQRIRQLDLQLRQRYFQQLSRMGSGVYLLLGGVAVFVLAVTPGARYRRHLPMPQPKPDALEQATRSAARARWSVAAGGAAIGRSLLCLCVSRGA